MTMPRTAAWEIVGLVIGIVICGLGLLTGLAWAVLKVWAWLQGPAPGL